MAKTASTNPRGQYCSTCYGKGYLINADGTTGTHPCQRCGGTGKREQKNGR